jgi:Na+-translocating ferredoxin:NAD+ oxidoreductase RnfD subunit
MDDFFSRIWEHAPGRISGPMWFRLLLQPAMATFFAIRAGLKDARTGQSPYAWAIAHDPAHRAMLLREGWKSIAKIFVLAAVLEGVYQVKVFHWVYPVELLLIAFLLACLPYLLIRGFVTRIAAGRRERHQP